MFISRTLSQAAKSGTRPGTMAPKEGSCGIPPWAPDLAPPPPVKTPPLPSHLVRPPCMPGSEPGDRQTCLEANVGLYCLPCRKKYKYPPFSENIDFVPPGLNSCWWKVDLSCPVEEINNSVLQSITQRWRCDEN